ncbi:MAG: HdeD family acid-resistance protein [Minicystis sp.]
MANPIQNPETTPRITLVALDSVRANRSWFIGLGVIFMVLGVLAIVVPFIGSLVTAIAIGWVMIVGGIVQGIHAVQNPGWAGRGWEIASSVLEVLVGILVVAFPVAGTVTLTLVLAAWFAAEGVLRIVRAVQHKNIPNWGWLMFDGVLSLGLGILILAGWPSTAVWALGLLVGVNLLIGGSSMLLIGIGAGTPRTVRP